MPLSVSSGPARVIEHGTVTTFGGQDLEILLDMPEGAWSVRLIFEENPEISGAAVSTEMIDGGMIFECVNFQGADGRGSAVPVLLGELGEDLVFFHFRVFQHGQSDDHSVHYTFFRVHKDAVDWQPSAG